MSSEQDLCSSWSFSFIIAIIIDIVDILNIIWHSDYIKGPGNGYATNSRKPLLSYCKQLGDCPIKAESLWIGRRQAQTVSVLWLCFTFFFPKTTHTHGSRAHKPLPPTIYPSAPPQSHPSRSLGWWFSSQADSRICGSSFRY